MLRDIGNLRAVGPSSEGTLMELSGVAGQQERPAPQQARPGDASSDRLSLRLAVLTYNRPQDIAALLPLLVDQARRAAVQGRAVDVVVVDNDPEASARSTVESMRDLHPEVPLVYEHEPRPGISAGR